VGALFFTFQIYGDFSGYSDIAIGTSRLFGFDLMQNFAFPYFSRDIAEFWRRWHISLSTWFRDYVYIPLGGSRGGTWSSVRNTFIIFIVSGFWHGANWTFIVWGALNAIYFLPLLLLKKNRRNLGVAAVGRTFPSIRETFQILTTFALTVLTWIFFRAEDLSHAWNYLKTIFSGSLFTIPVFQDRFTALITSAFIIFFLLIEWKGREDEFALERFGFSWVRGLRWFFYASLIFAIMWYAGNQQTFIYFQF
jgi:D-alanyl-lipoteichoic acid acyltransferase DltB (MBOAT superfamily)